MSSQIQLEGQVDLAHQVINEPFIYWTHFSHPGIVSLPKTIAPAVKPNVNKDYIQYFCGDELFLSNFYPTPIRWEGLVYPSVEHALQASMCFNVKDRLFFTIGSVKDARRLGRRIHRHYFWPDILRSVINELLEIKFKDPVLKQKLLDTGGKLISVGHRWGHDYRDLNLSARLMSLRDNLRTGYDWRRDL